MRYVRLASLVGPFALMMLGSAAPAAAQSNDEGFPQIQWNFSTPGARANAMGRAFIGVADDASASITNPAGLVKLTRAQAYFEFKSTDLKVQRLANTDSLFTLTPTTFATTVNTPSFVSFSVPIGDRLAVGFTRHEFLDYKETYQLGPRPIPNHPISTFSLFPLEGTTDFTAVSYAGSVAVAIGPQLRIGVTASSDQLKANSLATRFDFVTTGPGKFALAKSAVIANQTSVSNTSSALGLVVGALWSPVDQVAVGVQYARGPKFVVTEDEQFNPGFRTTNTNQPLVPVLGFPLPVHINVPDRIGVGIAVRPSPRLLVAVDALRVGYSSLAKDFAVVFEPNVLTGSEYTFADVVELHAGGEYLVTTGATRLFVRAGVYTNPDHTTSFSGTADPGTNAIETAIYNLLPRKREVVGTFGAGVAMGAHGQLDVAYVWKREAVFSAGLRF